MQDKEFKAFIISYYVTLFSWKSRGEMRMHKYSKSVRISHRQPESGTSDVHTTSENGMPLLGLLLVLAIVFLFFFVSTREDWSLLVCFVFGHTHKSQPAKRVPT